LQPAREAIAARQWSLRKRRRRCAGLRDGDGQLRTENLARNECREHRGQVKHRHPTSWLPSLIYAVVKTLEPLQGQDGREKNVKIGELAQMAGCSADTIRFYEKEGLLPAAQRTEANYRRYHAGHLERLRFLRNCRSLDMTHEEIRRLLGAADGPGSDCGAVSALIDEHIGHVSTRIDELLQLRAHLVTLRERCAGAHAVEDCGIIHGLTEMDSVSAAKKKLSHLG
jgi:Cd(II)/Pb(II)-responsive transcriptional regulator